MTQEVFTHTPRRKSPRKLTPSATKRRRRLRLIEDINACSGTGREVSNVFVMTRGGGGGEGVLSLCMAVVV